MVDTSTNCCYHLLTSFPHEEWLDSYERKIRILVVLYDNMKIDQGPLSSTEINQQWIYDMVN